MAIDRIPGVGPANSDIAAAVAAPSAATIAAAVAAPSAATIAAAVAAPSSATIASAVAAAVPTISAINTAVANNAPSPNAWTLVGTITPNNTSSTLTFSGLSGYRTYRILIPYINPSTGSQLILRVNGDAGNSYTGRGAAISGSTWQTMATGVGDGYYMNYYSGSTLNYMNGVVEIENCNLAGGKFISSKTFVSGSSNSYYSDFSGHWFGTAAVNSLSIVNYSSGGTIGGGYVIYLYGAN
jgi:hypothetical protein